MRNRAHLFLVGICYNLKKMLTLEKLLDKFLGASMAGKNAENA
jgi:hypothetical protein